MTLLEQLQSYVPDDLTESAHLEQTLDFLGQTPKPFHRDTLVGHMTFAICIVADDQEILQKAEREAIALQWVSWLQLTQLTNDESLHRILNKLDRKVQIINFCP